jgi:fatty acid hydroxylase domain-containing protein 2
VWFYFTHRAMHHPTLYKLFHKQHHEFTTTVGISSEYAHPVEDIVVNMASTFVGAVVQGVHPFVLWFWVFVR